MKKVKLGEIGKIVTGCTPSTKKSEYYESNDYMFVGPSDIKNVMYVVSSEKHISQKAYEDHKTRFINGDSIVVDCIGSDMGNVAIVKEDCLTNQQINAITNIDENNYNIRYIYYVLSTMKNYFHLIGTNGSTMPILNKSMFENIEIEVPDIEIQNKIANILSKLDDKVKLNNEINNNLFDLGRTYFEDFISNCDEEVAIKDIADEVLDYTKNNNDKVKLLNSSDITENIFPKVEFIDNKDLKGHFKKRFKKYDILYSQIRPRNHHYGYVLLDDAENYLASTRFMVVRNKKEKVSSSLLYYYLTSKNAVEDFTTKTELRSGTFPQGNYEDLSSYVIRYSSNQELITKILDSILETINYNNNENEKLVELRDTLLPKLMNGEIDLDNIEI